MTPQERLLKEYGTSSEVARVAGVSRQCVHNWWKRGRIGAESLPYLSKVTGISMVTLGKEWKPVPGPRTKVNKRRPGRPAQRRV